MKRETQEDLDNEAEILNHACDYFKCRWSKLGLGGKYRIDAVLHREKSPVAWAEVKDYKRSLFLGLNVPKYMEGCRIAKVSGLPFLMIVRHERLVSYLILHNGSIETQEKRLLMAGGTPKGREALPDDVEPMFMFDQKNLKQI